MTARPAGNTVPPSNSSAVQPSTAISFLVYFVPVLGWLVGLIFLRRNVVAFYHACQALALTLGAIFVPLVWAVAGWVVAWIPLVGPVTAIASFSLVMAAALAVVVAWFFGLSNALQAKIEPVPFFGRWGERIFLRLVRPPEGVALVVEPDADADDADLDVDYTAHKLPSSEAQ